MSFGYMETPNILKGIAACRKQGLAFDIMSTSFFLSRRSLKASAHSGMPVWQDKLFIALAGSADSATDYFHIPAERVVEIGAQVTDLSAAKRESAAAQMPADALDRFLP